MRPTLIAPASLGVDAKRCLSTSSPSDVRWWLSTEEGELVSTVGGGDEKIEPRETMQLEAVEIPGWENFAFSGLWCRLAWRDVEGDHEKRRRFTESARGMRTWEREQRKKS